LAQLRRVHAQIMRGLRHLHTPLRNQLHASSLNSRVNFRLSMAYLRFHKNT
jgi:hypothetical protein